jgi:LysM repeat protein
MSQNLAKVRSLVAALLAAAAVLLPAGPAAAQNVCGPSVVVAFGETTSTIARRCGTNITAIMQANPLLPDPSMLIPGMRLRMPVSAAPAPTTGGTIVRYVVRPGDTLASIARANGLTLAAIYRLNPDVDARSLRAGDVVRLPGGAVRPGPQPPADTNIVRYTVRRGDTISSLARSYGMSREEILRLNPRLDPRSLRVGDIVRLRGGVVPPPETPDRPAAEPTLALSPSRGAPGSLVTVEGAGFRPAAQLRLLAGRDARSLREFQQVLADRRGRVSAEVRVPDWAAGAGTLVFALETLDGRLRVVSDAFRVAQAPATGRVDVTGTLTREGAECPAMRGDDGRLYTLAGDIGDFIAGDRVRVQGRIAEASYCQQGTTINVTRVEDASR